MTLKQMIGCAAMAAMTACTNTTPSGQGIGIDLANMDSTVAPGADFYRYACGNWMKTHPLPAEYARYGSFDQLIENNQKQLRTLIDELATSPQPEGTVGQKIADLYNMLMDSTRQNTERVRPIMSDYSDIAAVTTRDAIKQMMMTYEMKGASGLWATYLAADIMSSNDNLLQFHQGGMSMGEREYYLSNDESFVKVREAFRKHIVKMFCLMGDSTDVAERKMQSVMDIETRMARAAKTNVELRDVEANYHKMSYADFKERYTGLDWDYYFDLSNIRDIDSLSVGQPASLAEAMTIINQAPLQQLQDYLQWQLVDGNATLLGDDVFDQNFDFYSRTMNGQQQPHPRWKRCVATVEGVLGEAVGQMYVKQYFPTENKERMTQLVTRLQQALAQRIDAQDWMSDSTKTVAKDKLAAFRIKVGYPDKWTDYSSLNIDPEWNLYVTMQVVRNWSIKDEVERKWKKPVDPEQWHMTPQTVNAYYNPTTNEICFPAGILQPPFFDMSADDAFNYGAIGVVIGHEMTHGFDDQGRQFDKTGNFCNWWADADANLFKDKAQQMIDYFDGIEVLPGLKANGSFTVGENLADHGGLSVAFTAFQLAQQEATEPLPTVSGLTPEQRFFLAYAGVWAQNITEANMRQRTVSDPHSLGEWRVNGALPHIDAWYEAFGITPGDPLYIAPENRVRIW